MPHRILNGHDEVRDYERFLNEGWPERVPVTAHLCERLKRMARDDMRILELSPGPGGLAEAILGAIAVSEYVGVDISSASLQYAKQRVEKFAANSEWLQADLNQDTWLDRIDEGYDAVVSMQSLHDLGGHAEVARMLRLAHGLLVEGGVLLYADLLSSPSDPDGANPGRLTVDAHLRLLEQSGFARVACTLQIGGFGCFEAVRKDQSRSVTEWNQAASPTRTMPLQERGAKNV